MGAGKSTVAARLAERGAMVIDADAIAREVVEPGTGGLAEVVHSFGDGVLAPDGSLDRAALAARAFRDDESRQRLNAILHPRIGARTVELMATAPDDAIVVHDIPLLVESKLSAHYHLTIVVDAPVETRVRRLSESRGVDPDDARARIGAQASERERRAAADVWLVNDSAPADIRSEVDTLWTDRLFPFEENLRLRRPGWTEPVGVVDYDPTWQRQAERIMARVRQAAGDRALRIDHIGGTAVPGMAARDRVDLQLSVRGVEDADAIAEPLAVAGFVPHPGGTDVSDDSGQLHVSADPARPVRLHVRVTGSRGERLALLLRDWLRADAGAREEFTKVDGDGGATDVRDQWPWGEEGLRLAERWAADTGWNG